MAMSVLADRLAIEGLEVHYIPLECPETSPGSIRFHQTGWLTTTAHKRRSKRALAKFRNIVEKSSPKASAFLSTRLHKVLARGYERALSDADADVHIQVVAGAQTAYVANFCKRKKKPLIFRSTSLWDADLTFKWGWTSWRDDTKELYLQGIRRADIVAANSMDTARAFAKHVDEDRIRFIPDGFHVLPCPDLARDDGFVLWVGRDAAYKRAWLFADLARMLPKHQFVMVGDIHSVSNVPPNLHLLGSIEPGRLAELYSRAKVLVNTSEVEGFPNVLVEGAMYGVPYLSFLDPDGVLTKYSLGIHARSLDEMAAEIHALMSIEDSRLVLGKNARRFVEEHRDIEKVVKEWLNLFTELDRKDARRTDTCLR